MKVAFALLFVVAASSAVVIRNNYGVSNNAVDTLVRKCLEKIRTDLEAEDPFTLASLPTLTIVDTDVDLTTTLTNVQISNASDFVINTISNNILTLKNSFELTFPTIVLSGDYSISGTGFDKTVSGSGTFETTITDFVQSGSTKFQISDDSLQIKTLSLSYDLGGATSSILGLSVEGMTDAEVNTFMNNQFLTFIQNNKALAAKKVAAHVVTILNSVMKGMTLLEVLEWLKEFAA